jgi:hypothetical protein
MNGSTLPETYFNLPNESVVQKRRARFAHSPRKGCNIRNNQGENFAAKVVRSGCELRYEDILPPHAHQRTIAEVNRAKKVTRQ